MNVLEQLTIARSLLLLDHCFWGILAMKLKFIEDEFCETAATDGEVLLFNPAYIETLTGPARIGLEAHEVMHCAMGDIWRLDGRDHFIWNMACDYINNKMLVDAGFTLPDGCLLNSAYNGMCKEEVYKILYKKAPKEGEGKGKGDGKGKGKKGGKGKGGYQGRGKEQFQDPGKCGSMFKPADPDKAEEAKVEWKTATAQAVNMSAGKLPGNMQRTLKDEVLDPPLPWHALLRDFVQRTSRNDYNWSRPSRRYLSRGIILPGLVSDELPLTVVVRDTSGSCDHVQERFANEVSGILGSYNTTILVVDCDSKVYEPVEEYQSADLPFDLPVRGGGGTSFCPPFDYVEKQGITPACLIYLTDMYGRFPKESPDYPVLWVCVNEQKAPWGETVQMRVER